MDDLYNKVFEKLRGDMTSDADVDILRLYAAGKRKLIAYCMKTRE